MAGVTVQHDETTERSGETDAIEAGLRDGAVVKVSGAFAGATLLAKRIKHYGPDTDGTPELRGPVHSVRAEGGDGELVLGAVHIAFDAGTAWKDVETDAPRRLTREDVLSVLERGANAAASEGWTVESSLYDLVADPGELQPVARWTGPIGDATPDELVRLSRALDDLGANLAIGRIWSADDQALLSDEALGDLRAIGYVR
ncbi:MAG: DUF5666 domain-containing protein [Planctomycetota bacterium]